MTTAQIIFLSGMVLLLIYAITDVRKKEKAAKRLIQIYRDREASEKRKMKLIAEKPKYVIFWSELRGMNITLEFIGCFDELPQKVEKNYSLAVTTDNGERIECLYKDGQWYELVDDISHLRDIEKWC